MNGSKFVVFITVALSFWAIIHFYVFWRLATVPWIAAHTTRRLLISIAVILWGSYPLSHFLSAHGLSCRPFEFAAANWIGVLFLLFATYVIVDVLTLGGRVFTAHTSVIRTTATVVPLGMAIIALIQGLREPAMATYDLRLKGLPKERDGMVLVALSDLHLGLLSNKSKLTALMNRVDQLHPDMIFIVGDLVDGNAREAEPFIPILKTLQAPLGVWAVTGNHDFYAGLDQSLSLFEKAGFKVLHDQSVLVTNGLVVAGVDDLGTRFWEGSKPVEAALTNRPVGATLFLSHTPTLAENAAAHGVGLMLSGHTHNGQIWPFNYLVRMRYNLMAGEYEINGMTVIVCSGTGTWGPTMRLWKRSEFLKITLHPAPLK